MKHDDAKQDMKMDKKQDKAMIKKAMGQHDKQQHGGKKTALALKKGGPTTDDRMKMGRNMSRAANQRTK
jgi:hypothetical protein